MGLWIDVLIIFIVGSIVYVQARRGLIPALIECFGAYGVLMLVNAIDHPVAHSLTLFSRPETNVAFFHILLFFALCAPVVALGIFLDHAVSLSLDTFDTFVGGVLGLAAAVVVCHALIGGLQMGATPDRTVSSSIASSSLGQEVLHFNTWHNFLDAVGRMGEYED